MASKNLKEMADRLLADLEKTADAAEESVRNQLENQEGQILIINKTRFSTLLTQLVPRLRGSENQQLRNKVWNTFSARLNRLEAQVPKDILVDLKSIRLPGIRKNDYVFYVKNYASAKNAKGQILKEVVRDVLKNEKDFKNLTKKDAKVDISSKVKDFSRIKKAVDTAPDIDNSDKIADLKQRIASGSYNIDYDALADKMLQNEF